jgi:hypothetical protein
MLYSCPLKELPEYVPVFSARTNLPTPVVIARGFIAVNYWD